MPYLIRVIHGKEKKVIRLFAREGIELIRIPVSEYLIGHDPRCQEVRYLGTIEGYIIKMDEISDEEALRLRAQETGFSSHYRNVTVGNIVTVTEGVYKGQNGIVRKIINEKVTVDICLFGRMHPVSFEIDQVVLPSTPEVWR